MKSDTTTEGNKLEVTLPGDKEIHSERYFDAPRQLVWDCYTDPALIPDWMGPRRLTTRIIEWTFEVGGKWHYIATDTDGTEYEFFGEFKEIEEPSKVVQTFNFVMEPQPPPQIDTVVFEETGDGRTKMVANSVFELKEQRDGMVQSGMEDGMVETFDRLEEIIEGRKG